MNSKQVGGKGEPHREGEVGTPTGSSVAPLTYEERVADQQRRLADPALQAKYEEARKALEAVRPYRHGCSDEEHRAYFDALRSCVAACREAGRIEPTGSWTAKGISFEEMARRCVEENSHSETDTEGAIVECLHIAFAMGKAVGMEAGSNSDVQCDSSNKPISSDVIDELEGRR